MKIYQNYIFVSKQIDENLKIEKGQVLVIIGNSIILNGDLSFERGSFLYIKRKLGSIFTFKSNNKSSIIINSNNVQLDNITFDGLGDIENNKSAVTFGNNNRNHNHLTFINCEFNEIDILNNSNISIDGLTVDNNLNIIQKIPTNKSMINNINVKSKDLDDFNQQNLNYLLSNIDFNQDFSWITFAVFDYKNPDDSLLNLAYPSAIAYYYVTIIKPNSNYRFQGSFLTENVYECSLTVYNADGNINNEYPSLNTFNTNTPIDLLVSTNNTINYVLQRFYVNLDVYQERDLRENLFQVFKEDVLLEFPVQKVQEFVSNLLYKPFQKLILNNSISTDNTDFSPFFLPGSTTGLFPDKNHYYLVANFGNFDKFKIEGNFISSKEIPYIDFLIGNQNTTQTTAGLPFYEFVNEDNKYTIYVYKKTSNVEIPTNQNTLIIEEDNINPIIIFRIITYSTTGISQATGPLTPEETEEVMTSGFYPTITPIQNI